MYVPLWAWLATTFGLVALLALDLVIVDRKPHKVSAWEAGRWVILYVGCAVVFGLLVWLLAGSRFAGEFFSGYLTEYSLSVDNLFVFLVIMTAFKVPAIHQHRVLLIGIVIALVLRSVLIMAGSLIISKFFAIFYVFGAFLIFTAYRLVRDYDKPENGTYSENVVLRWLRKIVPVTKDYRGSRSFIRENGKRAVTPMLVVIIAIGTTDLLFALDSIPAVFGLTQQPFLVFAVNAFALMGLRQLYFLIGGLLDKLVYLPIGLAALLLFIGAKLILEVLHTDSLPFVPGAQKVAVPVIGTGVSLGVVVGVLAITVVASLLKNRHDARQHKMT
ncbi:MAG TPA: TerC/Alx family metal homeostasis membrane protein [Pseudonocardiaceae bacterium]|nr:TerC/Alx family metal homeostasis membrane protein [Pseudonocardiaceae bacterium]